MGGRSHTMGSCGLCRISDAGCTPEGCLAAGCRYYQQVVQKQRLLRAIATHQSYY